MTTWAVLFNNTEEKLVGYQALAVSTLTKRTLSDWSIFDFHSRKLGTSLEQSLPNPFKACDTKQKCHVLTKPEIKCRLVKTVPCLRRNKYNLVPIRHTFLVLFYYQICLLYYFISFAVKENTPNTRRVRLHDNTAIDWTYLGPNIWNHLRFCRG